MPRRAIRTEFTKPVPWWEGPGASYRTTTVGPIIKDAMVAAQEELELPLARIAGNIVRGIFDNPAHPRDAEVTGRLTEILPHYASGVWGNFSGVIWDARYGEPIIQVLARIAAKKRRFVPNGHHEKVKPITTGSLAGAIIRAAIAGSVTSSAAREVEALRKRMRKGWQ